MKWSAEVRAEIVAALGRVLPDQHLRPCAFCGSTQWILVDAFVAMLASSEFWAYPMEQSKTGFASQDVTLPFIVMSCQHCGNTHFLNVRLLGLDYLVVPQDPVLLPPPPDD